MRVRLYSHLPLSECQQRLEAATDRPYWRDGSSFHDPKQKPVIARISGMNVQLYKRRYSENYYASARFLDTFFFGSLIDNTGGTQITGRIGLELRAITNFCGLWLFMIMISLMIIAISLSEHTPTQPSLTQVPEASPVPLWLVLGSLSVICAIHTLFFQRALKRAKEEAPFLMGFLKTTLEAEEMLQG